MLSLNLIQDMLMFWRTNLRVCLILSNFCCIFRPGRLADDETDACEKKKRFFTADILIDVITGEKSTGVININEEGSTLLVLCMLAHKHDLLGHV